MKSKSRESGPAGPEGRGLDEGVIEDATVAQTLKEDPIIRFLYLRRWEVCCVLVAAGALFYSVQQYRRSYSENMSRAADAYAEVRDEYAQLGALQVKLDEREQAAENTEKEDSGSVQEDFDLVKRRLESKLRILAEREPPYDKISSVYNALLAVAGRDPAEVEKFLENVNWDRQSGQLSLKRLLGESSALMLARALLDDPDRFQTGWETLKALAQGGQHVHVPAVLTMARIASTDAQRADVRAGIDAIIAAYPEQESLLEEERQRMGVGENLE